MNAKRSKQKHRNRNDSRPKRSTPKLPWYLRPMFVSLVSGFVFWMAFAPLKLWPLAFVAPLGWVSLVRAESLPAGRPYRAIWCGAFLFWLLMLQGIRSAHPLLYLGWVALAAYLAAYMPAFVAIARIAFHRLRVPLFVAVPAVWVGLELTRGYMITGFSMGLISHALAEKTALIQVASFAGAYGVSFWMMVVVAAVYESIHLGLRKSRRAWVPIGLAPITLIVVSLYGNLQLREQPSDSAAAPAADQRQVKVALIQGTMDTIFEFNGQLLQDTFRQYSRLAQQAIQDDPEIDLIVWPESIFFIHEIQKVGNPTSPTPLMDQLSFEAWLADRERAFELTASGIAADLARYPSAPESDAPAPSEDTNPSEAGPPETNSTEINSSEANAVPEDPTTEDATEEPAIQPARPRYLLTGSETEVFQDSEHIRYNAALLLSDAGTVESRYFKMHRVMFGEYIPFGDTFPWIYKMSPMPSGLTPGAEPTTFQINDITFAPNICFESTVPHLIWAQMRQLKQADKSPDVMVNVTNDGWFWGSSMLDLHFACGVFRAIENGRPHLIAANPGLSGWIDGRGRVIEKTRRREEQVIIATIRPERISNLYQHLGDALGWMCVGFCLLTIGVRITDRFRSAGTNQNSA